MKYRMYITKIKKVVSIIIGIILIINMFPIISLQAEETKEKYPYTFFAGAEKEGAIKLYTNNACINGNIATNGTIDLQGNVNINGTKKEYVDEDMIYIFNILESIYYDNKNVSLYSDDYVYNDTNINININTPMLVQGKIDLNGNISINSAMRAMRDMCLQGEIKNANNSIVCSEYGDIVINSINANLNGLIYAPRGNVKIIAQNLNLNNVIIIANTIELDCDSINANYNIDIAEIIGRNPEDAEDDEDKSDTEEIYPDLKNLELYTFGKYNSEQHAVNIEIYTNINEGNFDIFESNDGNNFVKIGENFIGDIFEYQITTEFEKKYFKVSYSKDEELILESLPFVIEKKEDTYVSLLLDSDDDGIADLIEIRYGTDCSLEDTDNDGLSDYQEICIAKTEPTIFDSVSNGIADAESDLDGDGLSNIQEINLNTKVYNMYTDDDEFTDYHEIYIYGTDPLETDTDNDGLDDSEEFVMGLNPNEPKTFGIPDLKYRVIQSIPAESESLREINIENAKYSVSMDIIAAGYAEKNISVKESSYSNTIQNEAVVGIPLEIKYKKDIDSITLKYQINSQYIGDMEKSYYDEDELMGIKKFNIFKYFEELNMLLPIETKFDIGRNIVYSEVDEEGTYCLMNMESWVSNFEFPEDSYLLDTAESCYSFDEVEKDSFCETVLSQNAGIEEVTDCNIENEEYENTTFSLLYDFQSTTTNDVKKPIEAVFLLQIAGNQGSTYNLQKNMIGNVMEKLIIKYGEENVRFCVITYGNSGAKVLRTNEQDNWFTNCEELKNELNELSYEFTSAYVDREPAFILLLNQITYNRNSAKFIFELMNGANQISGSIFDYLADYAKSNINYSEIHPVGQYYDNVSNANTIKELIYDTNGLFLEYTSNTAMQIYDHMCTYSEMEPIQVEYNIIVATGWKKIILDGELSSENGIDTDNDGLIDWEETDTNKLTISNDGTIGLPTIQECVNYAEKEYVKKGLERFKSELWPSGMPSSDFEKYLYYILNNTYVLPILSDPTLKDSDGDGLLDGTNTVKNIVIEEQIQSVEVAPKDPSPLEYTGVMEIWNSHIAQYESGIVATDYADNDFGVGIELEQTLVDYLISVLLQYRETINNNEKYLQPILEELKLECEDEAILGAYFLNFIRDNEYVAYHSQVDTWQRKFGYNDAYDDVFRISTQMHLGKANFEVESTKEKYMLWFWKGDYWNMQSGAEMGLYVYDETIEETEHYNVVEFELPMSLSLYNYQEDGDIVNVFNWHPNEAQWWITGFNTAFTNADPKEMVVVGSIDFSRHEILFEALKNSMEVYWENISKKDNLIFDENGHTLWIMWDYGVMAQ